MVDRLGRTVRHGSTDYRASTSRRSEAVIDLLRILHTSHPRGIFRSVARYCPHLKEAWDRSTLLRMRCSAANSKTVTWYRNGSPLKPSHRVTPSRYGQTWYLYIIYPRILDAGCYSCVAQRGCSSSQSKDALVSFQIEGTVVSLVAWFSCTKHI